MGFGIDVYNIIIALLGSITFLGNCDEDKAKLDLFFEEWQVQDDNFFESFKAIYVKSQIMQDLFDKKDIDFPVTQSGIFKQDGFCDKLTPEQRTVLIEYLNSEDFKNTLISL